MSKATIERKLLAIWYPGTAGNYKPNILLRLFLNFLSKIYYLAIKLRYNFFKLNVFKSCKVSVPVIIVGNITVGGTGKTSFVIALAKYLASQGLKPGIITRGYHPDSSNIPLNQTLLLSKSINYNLRCNQTGDEAQLLFNNTGVPVAVNRDRVAAVKTLIEDTQCNIILSDDGLQHYRLQRDLEICLVDSVRMFGNNKLLPAGPLRETSRRLNAVDFLLLKDHGFGIKPDAFVNLDADLSLSFEEFGSLINGDIEIHAYAGLGNNDSFFNLLSSVFHKGCYTEQKFIKHYFTDHYHYQAKDFKILDRNVSFKNCKRCIIITTEKDAVKIKDLLKGSAVLADIYFLKIEATLHQDFLLNFDLKLKEIIEKYSLDHKQNTDIKERDYVR